MTKNDICLLIEYSHKKTIKMNFLESSLKPKQSIWYYILVIFLAFMAANTIGAIPLLLLLLSKIFKNGIQDLPADDLMSMSNPEMMGISTNFFLVLMIIPFVVGLITLVLLVKAFNKKKYTEIVNGTNRIRFGRIMWGAGVWAAVLGLYMFIDYMIDPANYIFRFELSSFIPLVFISLLLIPFQTSFEEFVFRGYLTQGIAGATKSRIWALIIPSVVFGLMHIFNPEISRYGFWIMMPQYILIGFLFGIVSVLDDGIEIALGMHAANNIFLSLFVTHSSSVLQTAAVFEQQSLNPYKELIVLVVSGILVLSFFCKKYNWDFKLLKRKVAGE